MEKLIKRGLYMLLALGLTAGTAFADGETPMTFEVSSTPSYGVGGVADFVGPDGYRWVNGGGTQDTYIDLNQAGDPYCEGDPDCVSSPSRFTATSGITARGEGGSGATTTEAGDEIQALLMLNMSGNLSIQAGGTLYGAHVGAYGNGGAGGAYEGATGEVLSSTYVNGGLDASNHVEGVPNPDCLTCRSGETSGGGWINYMADSSAWAVGEGVGPAVVNVGGGATVGLNFDKKYGVVSDDVSDDD